MAQSKDGDIFLITHLEVKLLEGSQANWYPLVKTGDSQWKEFGGCSGIYISALKI